MKTTGYSYRPTKHVKTYRHKRLATGSSLSLQKQELTQINSPFTAQSLQQYPLPSTRESTLIQSDAPQTVQELQNLHYILQSTDSRQRKSLPACEKFWNRSLYERG